MNPNPIALVVSDLAGTTVDYGSRAPLMAFCELFKSFNIEVSEKQARIPMGKGKKEHIEEMLNMPEIAAKWQVAYDRSWNNNDLEAMYDRFIPLQLSVLKTYSQVIPGALEAIEVLRSKDIKIAATTGYNRAMTDLVVEEMGMQGIAFNCVFCADDVPAGRPEPWMIYRCMEATRTYPPSKVVKIGDTLADIRDGVNAGVWTVGIALTGNMIGLPLEEIKSIPDDELKQRRANAHALMYESGADMVIDSISDIDSVLGSLVNRIDEGMKPGQKKRL